MRTLSRWFTRTVSEFTFPKCRRTQHTHYARKMLSCALGIGIAKCSEGQLQQLTTESLTPNQCIKQACLLSVNSATTLLTTASSAILESCKVYKESLNRILSLLEQLQAMEGENPLLWDAIVEERGNVNKAKAAVTDLSFYMDTVEKVVNSTTEAAFLAGAEYISTALCERLYSAQKEINNQILELKKLEEDYVKMQKEIIIAKGKEELDDDQPRNKKLKNTKSDKVLAESPVRACISFLNKKL